MHVYLKRWQSAVLAFARPDTSLLRLPLLPVPNGGGGANSPRTYSQQRHMRTNLSCCLGLSDNGQHKST